MNISKLLTRFLWFVAVLTDYLILRMFKSLGLQETLRRPDTIADDYTTSACCLRHSGYNPYTPSRWNEESKCFVHESWRDSPYYFPYANQRRTEKHDGYTLVTLDCNGIEITYRIDDPGQSVHIPPSELADKETEDNKNS